MLRHVKSAGMVETSISSAVLGEGMHTSVLVGKGVKSAVIIVVILQEVTRGTSWVRGGMGGGRSGRCEGGGELEGGRCEGYHVVMGTSGLVSGVMSPVQGRGFERIGAYRRVGCALEEGCEVETPAHFLTAHSTHFRAVKRLNHGSTTCCQWEVLSTCRC